MSFEALPAEVVRGCLSFLRVTALLARVQAVSRRHEQLVKAMVGLSGASGAEADLAHCRRQVEALRSWFAGLSRNPCLRTGLGFLCAELGLGRCEFGELVPADDRSVQRFIGVSVLDYSWQYGGFGTLASTAEHMHNLMQRRRSFLLQHFTPREPRGDATESPLELGALTSEGAALCNRIFSYFDVDGDGLLGWEELSALSRAAGNFLSRNTFRAVQSSYSTARNGRLTRSGYRAMFSENFRRVPRLMYQDLVRLRGFMVACDRGAMARAVLREMAANEALEAGRARLEANEVALPQDLRVGVGSNA